MVFGKLSIKITTLDRDKLVFPCFLPELYMLTMEMNLIFSIKISSSAGC